MKVGVHFWYSAVSLHILRQLRHLVLHQLEERLQKETQYEVMSVTNESWRGANCAAPYLCEERSKSGERGTVEKLGAAEDMSSSDDACNFIGRREI